MDKKEEALIVGIKNGLAEFLNPRIFSAGSDGLLIKACKDFLIYKGYRVIDPIKGIEVKNVNELVDIFYQFKDYYHPEDKAAHRDLGRDRGAAKLFVDTRMNTARINKQQALIECAMIIKTIFEHEKEFNFKFPVSIGVLGQKNVGWITKKALEIIDRKNKYKKEEEAERLREQALAKQDMAELGFNDLDDILAHLDKEGNNA